MVCPELPIGLPDVVTLQGALKKNILRSRVIPDSLIYCLLTALLLLKGLFLGPTPDDLFWNRRFYIRLAYFTHA